MEIKLIPIEKLKRDNNQPRQTFDENHIRDMAQSITTEGVINPIEIDKNFVIITGEMRFRASKLAGLKKVPCKILDFAPKERFRRQVIENIHHNTMNDWDTAKALQKLLAQLPMIPGRIGKHGGRPNQGYSELSRIIGKSKDFISEHLEILIAAKPIQKAIQDGKIPYTLLRGIELSPIPYQKAMEKKIIDGEFTKRESILEVAGALKRNPEKAVSILEIDYTDKNAKQIGETLSKISPRYPDQIATRLAPGEEFTKIKKELIEWLKENPPQRIIQMDKMHIVLGMSLIMDKLIAWRESANQLKIN